jgi:hypothetical protein
VSHGPEIELLWWRGCPSTDDAVELVRSEMEQAGLEARALRVREVRSEEEAADLGFRGSPTVRIDGRDVVEPADAPGGLTCRVYRLRDGRVSPLPDRADVRRALTEATGGE